MGEHLLVKVEITMLNQLTESDVTELTISTVHDTALAILKRRESQGITVITSQSKFIFNI
jgi:hypothetical protein